MSAYKLEIDIHKQKLIDKYLIPALGDLGNNQFLIERLYESISLRSVVKYQILEEPGEREDGCLYFMIGAMCHSYTYKKLTGKLVGTRIYKRKQFVFNGHWLMEGADRKDFVEMLEPGEVLYISYMNLQLLMYDFAVFTSAMWVQKDMEGNYFCRHAELLQEPALERIQKLSAEQPEFIRCSSHEIQARHLNMNLRTYYRYRKILNEMF